MSSASKKVQKQIVEQRISTVVQVLSIMQSEADKMSWFQRFLICNRFLWKKDISNFFQLAKRNRNEGQKDIQNS